MPTCKNLAFPALSNRNKICFKRPFHFNNDSLLLRNKFQKDGIIFQTHFVKWIQFPCPQCPDK